MLLLVCLLLCADEPPPQIARILAASEVEKQRIIADTIRTMGRVTGTRRNQLKVELARLRESDDVFFPKLGQPLVKGTVGILSGEFAKVRQVVGPNDMLCEALLVAPEVLDATGTRIVRKQRVDEVLFMVRGVGTANLSDGSTASLPHKFEVTENYTYQTAIGGSKTVMVLEPIDMKLVYEWRDKLAKAKKKK